MSRIYTFGHNAIPPAAIGTGITIQVVIFGVPIQKYLSTVFSSTPPENNFPAQRPAPAYSGRTSLTPR
jgi:hypothetical protein